ncbi:unnamed protein product [marine sediment metagenome]|uniref:Uncharacterized protein n=1 Tax=marine sediment metagenome TaxID=412755 RepID=X0V3C6_9ZZZZ
MQKIMFDRIIKETEHDWPTVLKGALLEVGCTDAKAVSIEHRHIVASFIERRIAEDNFSIYNESFEDDYGYIKRDAFDRGDYGIIKDKYGEEERG